MRRGALFCFALLVAGSSAAQDAPQTELPRTRLFIGAHALDVQLASTPMQRQNGLMHRRDMAESEGMLFVYESPALRCFWMRHTPLPLSAAFIDENAVILNLADMQPLSDATHCSIKPARYVLEMHQGWFTQRGIGSYFLEPLHCTPNPIRRYNLRNPSLPSPACGRGAGGEGKSRRSSLFS